jgi:hypothetical protein
MNRVAWILMLFISNTALSHELSKDIWHSGSIVLETNDTLRGDLKYDIEENILQYRYGNKMVTLTPKKVISFFFYDKLIESNRYFRVLEYSLYDGYKPDLFFEVLVVGNLSLLCREYIKYETVMFNDPFLARDPYLRGMNNSNYVQRKVVDYIFYFFDTNGKKTEVTEYSEKKRDLYKIMKPHEDEIKDFIKKRKIFYDTRLGLQLITEYYNQLDN